MQAVVAIPPPDLPHTCAEFDLEPWQPTAGACWGFSFTWASCSTGKPDQSSGHWKVLAESQSVRFFYVHSGCRLAPPVGRGLAPGDERLGRYDRRPRRGPARIPSLRRREQWWKWISVAIVVMVTAATARSRLRRARSDELLCRERRFWQWREPGRARGRGQDLPDAGAAAGGGAWNTWRAYSVREAASGQPAVGHQGSNRQRPLENDAKGVMIAKSVADLHSDEQSQEGHCADREGDGRQRRWRHPESARHS